MCFEYDYIPVRYWGAEKYDQVSVNGYNLGTNSVKIISYQKNIIFNGFIVLGGLKLIGIINFGTIL